MSSQVLITGATGFIGRQLTRDLISRGVEVRILARNPQKAEALFGENVEIVIGNLGDSSSLDQACRDIEVIYHIGGIYRFGLRHRRELWRINVMGTENLFRSASAAGVGKVVHLSSASVLKKQADPSDLASLINETHFPTEVSSQCPYKASKWHAEQRALAWAGKGLPVVIASTTCPIGNGDETPTPTGRIVRDFLDRRFPFYCHTGLNFIGVSDLSEGLQKIAAHGRTGERYLLCHENLWLKEFLDLLAEETGIAAPTRCLPNWLIRLIGYGGEVADFLNPGSSGARICLETAIKAEQVQFFSNAKAREELGWQPVSTIQENIREAIGWFRCEQPLEIAQTAPSSVQSSI